MKWTEQIFSRRVVSQLYRPLLHMWREALQELSSDLAFNSPGSEEDIVGIEQALGVRLPDELQCLPRESNGVEGKYGLGLLWEATRICADNLTFRSSFDFGDLYMPFDHLLFFGDAGNGDQFAFPILRNGITRSDIFVWNHEDDSRSWVAPSLGTFYNWWLTGKVKV